jgi:hypothetical protein
VKNSNAATYTNSQDDCCMSSDDLAMCAVSCSGGWTTQGGDNCGVGGTNVCTSAICDSNQVLETGRAYNHSNANCNTKTNASLPSNTTVPYNGTGRACIFPVKYYPYGGNTMFTMTECTTNAHTAPWCYVEQTANGVGVSGVWGECESACTAAFTTNKKTSCCVNKAGPVGRTCSARRSSQAAELRNRTATTSSTPLAFSTEVMQVLVMFGVAKLWIQV